jgi:glutamate/tyrosine decarboxylase-like PLP-dependent enzyme
MAMGSAGVSRDQVLGELDALRADDVRWRTGRAFTLAYHGGDDVVALAEEAYRRASGDNALNTTAFPSLRRMQADVVATVAGWLGAPDGSAGSMTSGGTESLLLAVEAARQRARVERGTTRPNMVLPTSAHAAFEKAARYFGVESRRIPVTSEWRADPEAMEAAIDDDTVLLVASAPQYPQGVIDPVAAVAALAAERGINCHVDACMGGVTLHYLRRLGEPVPPWNFEVDGVTSISVDLHKYGYTAKGASVLLHRTRALRDHQVFVTDNWLGGRYGSSGIQGTKSGGAIAAAWAVQRYLGDEGYLRLTAAARRACLQLVQRIATMPDLRLLAEPEVTLLAITAAEGSDVDVFAVADELWRRGWMVDKQGPPASMHLTVNAIHDGLIDEFAGDLRASVAAAHSTAAPGSPGAYATPD